MHIEQLNKNIFTTSFIKKINDYLHFDGRDKHLSSIILESNSVSSCPMHTQINLGAVHPKSNHTTTGCSIKKVTKYWAVKPIKNVILRLSKSLKLPKIWDILITSQVFSKGGLKFPFKASRSQIPKYLIFHNTGYKIFT